MKVLHLSTYEKKGGAAIAAFRLNEAMKSSGIDSDMLVCRVSTRSQGNPYMHNPRITKMKQSFLSHCSQFIQKYLLKSEFIFSLGYCGVGVSQLAKVREADVIYIHWINHNFLSIKEISRILKLGKPVVLFMHDMWTITGGCHHSFECRKYETACADCPGISNVLFKNVVSGTYSRKHRLMAPYENLYIMSPSEWLSDCVKASALFKKRFLATVPNTVDTRVFKPHDKKESRQILNLSQSKKYILFVANGGNNNPHKGWTYLKEALALLKTPDVEIIMLGGGGDSDLSVRTVGYVRNEDSIVLLYNAVDVLVSSSLAESFGLTILEALACGTIAVGFDVGGIPDLIKHKQTGYLAKYKDSADLANGIDWALNDQEKAERRRELSEFVMQHFSYEAVARKHLDLMIRCQQSFH